MSLGLMCGAYYLPYLTVIAAAVIYGSELIWDHREKKKLAKPWTYESIEQYKEAYSNDLLALELKYPGLLRRLS